MDTTTPRTALERLLILATPGHGWFESADAHAAGIDPSALSRLRSAGIIRSPRRGVNRLVVFPESWESSALGALISAGPDSALGRWAALRAHERRTTRPRIDIVVPRHRRRKLTTQAERTHVRFTPDDAVVVDGLRCTTPAFTVCDLAAVTDDETLLEVTERFLADGRLSLAELKTMVGRFRGVKGVGSLRTLADIVDPGVEGTRSDHERLAHRIVRRLTTLPPPIADLAIVDASGRERFLDLAWPAIKLAVEIDVHGSHLTTLGRRSDGRRQNDLVTLGWTVLRFDERDLRERPDEVARTIIRAYHQLTRST